MKSSRVSLAFVIVAATAVMVLLAPPAVAARESIAHELGGVGICQQLSLLADLDVCSRDGGSSGDLGPFVSSFSTSAAAAASKLWTHSKPCFQNDTNSPEFCVFTDTSFADNRGISIITTAERSLLFAKKEGFTNPKSVHNANRNIVKEEHHNLPPLPYEVKEMPGKGFGVVASKFLQRGDLVMSTTAFIVVDYAVFESVPEAEINRLQAAGIRLLPEAHRARVMNLSVHEHYDDHDERVAGILATNAFDIESEEDDDSEYGLFVVFSEISRLNHDCRPNADYFYDHDTLTQHIHATRPIAAGEEITVSYIDLVRSRKQRQQKLHDTWGFQCSCSLCTQSHAQTRASDARIAQIRRLRREFHNYSVSSRATPAMAELMVSLYEQERLDSMLYEAYTYAALEWNGVGEPWTATKYARRAIEYGLMSVGARDADVTEMRALAVDPWAHWSWMLRTIRRMQWRTGEERGTKKKTAKVAGDEEEEEYERPTETDQELTANIWKDVNRIV